MTAEVKEFDERAVLASLHDSDFENDEEFKMEVDKELKSKIQLKEPVMEDYLNQILIIDNTPCVPLSKIDKFKQQFMLLFQKSNTEVRSIQIPTEGDKSKGTVLVFFETPEDCKRMRDNLNNTRFSANHVLRCFTIPEYEVILEENTVEEDVVHQKEYEALPGTGLHLDSDSTLAISNTSGTVYVYGICPFDVRFTFEKFSPPKIEWSPLGTYLIGYNERGLMLITACTHHKVSRKFPHKNVINSLFSSNEKYLLTYSIVQAAKTQKMCVCIWDTNYHCAPIKTISGDHKPFNIFKFSSISAYLSYIIDDYLFIYNLETKSLVSTNPMKIPNIQLASWSPNTSELIYLEKSTDAPSTLTILQIPSMERKFRRQIFNLEKCQVIYNSSGSYLALNIVRSPKKSTQSLFEIIDLKMKDSSVQTVETKTQITCFAWEPYGDVCVVISPPITQFFKNSSGTFNLIKSIDTRTLDMAHWSPIGRFVILAQTKHNVAFEVYIYDQKTVSILGRGSQIDANYIAWDPTGRYFVTCSCGPDGINDKINFWSCAGYIVCTTRISSLAYCLWRPIPHLFLTETQLNEMWNNIDELIKQHSSDIKSISSSSFTTQETATVDRNILLPSTTERINRLKEINKYLKKSQCLQTVRPRVPLFSRSYTVSSLT